MASAAMVYLELDPVTSSVSRVLTIDSLGNESDLLLSRMKENVDVKDDVFDLRLPPGVEVRDDTASAAPPEGGP
jgi:outer membrane lipoprotein-sorting protein